MIRVSIHGRLGGDPVERGTRAGGAMVTASVAVNVAKPGEEQDAEWFSLVAFGRAAEGLAQHSKGALIAAMGPLTRSTFTGRDGKERSSWSLVVESILSAHTVYDRPHETGATTRPRRPRSTSRPYAPRRPATSSPDLPDDRVDDLYADGLVP
jgi:single-strand DNA-binding protein